MSIEVQKVSRSYGRTLALSEVSFSIGSGEIIGFLGPNGAGKSTLMKILTTYLSADSGAAKVNGFDVRSQAKAVRASVGYLPENNPLYLDLYVLEYLKFHAGIHGVSRQRIEEVIALVGLESHRSKKLSELSKGYKQRAGLGAALLHDPEVLILDEPTTGLDPNQLLEIRNLILEIGKTKTILLSTHIMQEVKAMCERVIILNQGEVVADEQLSSMLGNQEQTIEVEFDLAVEARLLKQIPHLSQAENLGDNLWSLRFDTDEDMRSKVFDFAIEQGLKTLKLDRRIVDLEERFRALTSTL